MGWRRTSVDLKSIRFATIIILLETASWKTEDPSGHSDDLATEENTPRKSPEKQITVQYILRPTYVFALKFYSR